MDRQLPLPYRLERRPAPLATRIILIALTALASLGVSNMLAWYAGAALRFPAEVIVPLMSAGSVAWAGTAPIAILILSPLFRRHALGLRSRLLFWGALATLLLFDLWFYCMLEGVRPA